ncbi:HGGxSTG domain-containing protein [Methylopila sp. M107]|uniref:HGGxSTG domain-containing protein n=1 Tax=Methylopila sp. M107 TaxID=1101190 RepID=UPI0009DC3237|nr:HGGxSTG domain-containing protein [Methylopila sp. M107]
MARNRRTPRKPGTPEQEAWWRSARFRAHARGLAIRNIAELARRPKCGAKAKATGQPCRNAAMANGRCRYHGGRTPSGDQWHVVQLPDDPRSPAADQKRARKLADRKLIDHRRRLRKAGMTPEERVKHETRSRALRPAPALKRERSRLQRIQAAEIKELLDRPSPPKSAEMQQIERDLAELRAQIAERAERHSVSLSIFTDKEGLFS